MPVMSKLLKSVLRLARRDHGGATIETVLWLPVFALILGIVADTSLVFGSQAEALRIVQDANRSLSLGRIRTTAAAEAFVLQQVSELSPNAVVDVQIIDGVIVTRLDMPVTDLSAAGAFVTFSGLNVSVVSEFMSEV